MSRARIDLPVAMLFAALVAAENRRPPEVSERLPMAGIASLAAIEAFLEAAAASAIAGDQAGVAALVPYPLTLYDDGAPRPIRQCRILLPRRD